MELFAQYLRNNSIMKFKNTAEVTFVASAVTFFSVF